MTHSNFKNRGLKTKHLGAFRWQFREPQTFGEISFKSFNRISDDSTDSSHFDVVLYRIWLCKIDARHCADVNIRFLNFDLDRLLGKTFAFLVHHNLAALENYRCVLVCSDTRFRSRLPRVSADTEADGEAVPGFDNHEPGGLGERVPRRTARFRPRCHEDSSHFEEVWGVADFFKLWTNQRQHVIRAANVPYLVVGAEVMEVVDEFISCVTSESGCQPS